MTTTIDSLDINTYYQYARRSAAMEQIQEEFSLDQATRVPYHTVVVDTMPKVSEMQLLLGVVGSSHMPWAFFVAPKKFDRQRRSPFTKGRVAPSLGSDEKQEADVARVMGIACKSEEEEEEREAIINCYAMLGKLNKMLGFIIGRVGQFLQG